MPKDVHTFINESSLNSTEGKWQMLNVQPNNFIAFSNILSTFFIVAQTSSTTGEECDYNSATVEEFPYEEETEEVTTITDQCTSGEI